MTDNRKIIAAVNGSNGAWRKYGKDSVWQYMVVHGSDKGWMQQRMTAYGIDIKSRVISIE